MKQTLATIILLSAVTLSINMWFSNLIKLLSYENTMPPIEILVVLMLVLAMSIFFTILYMLLVIFKYKKFKEQAKIKTVILGLSGMIFVIFIGNLCIPWFMSGLS